MSKRLNLFFFILSDAGILQWKLLLFYLSAPLTRKAFYERVG